MNGTIILTGKIDITISLTITGPGADQITISGNDASQVFRITGSPDVAISELTISNGSAADTGGGIFWQSSGALTLTKVIMSNNTAANDGGAFVHRRGDIVISESKFVNNTASNGSGGVFFTNADAGAISTTIDKSTFSNNQASVDGGAILNQTTLTITNSTFSNNTAGQNGGAISAAHFDPCCFTTDITNSTLSGNSAKENGGGIYYSETENESSLNNVTIYNNTADSDNNGSGDGGGFYELYTGITPDSAKVQNTIIAGNTDNGGEMPDCGGSDGSGDGHINSGDYNLIQDTTGCTISGTTTNNITGQSANLGALADNGGDNETHKLNGGSPAIDKGNPAGCTNHNGTVLTIDQRGEARPANGRCDIGAYEIESSLVSDGISSGACGGPCAVGIAGKYCTFCPDVSINVPANSVQNGSLVVVTELLESNTAGNFQLGNSVYDIKVFGPDGQLVTNFDPPLAVCIKPDNATLSAAGWEFANLTMFHSHAGGAWNPLLNSFEKDGKLCAEVSQLSLFTLTVLEMPNTGFTPGVVSALEDQPAEKAYFDLDATARSTFCDEAVSSVDVGDCFAGARNDSEFMLELPALGVELPIVGVPLSIEGWDVSWLGEAAGYLEGTAYPTWAGNTAITAHVWGADNNPGPFVDLHTLQHGDQIIIHAWGQKHVYEVRALTEVRPDDLRALPHSDYDVLTLITCKGFDPSSGEYGWRLAVKAVLIRIE